MLRKDKVVIEEVFWQLARYHPKTWDAILERMDISNEALDETLTNLHKEAET